jgi:hypothetical protein
MGGKPRGPINTQEKKRCVDGGTLCRDQSPTPGVVRNHVDEVLLEDQDHSTSRKIDRDSPEFRNNYIDYNINAADYWSTGEARSDKKYRDFWIYYKDGRQLKFNLDDIPIRRALPKGGRWARLKFKPQQYYKRGGFIYPDIYGEGSIPTLIDVATTIEYNHRQREKFLEVAVLTFEFAVILSAYAAPPEGGGPGGLRRPGSRLPKSPLVSSGAGAGEALAAEMRMRLGKVGVNIGGTGEVADYININNLSGGQKAEGIPNLIVGDGANIASYFKPGTVDRIVANNIIPGAVDWARVAKGSYEVLKEGGVVELAEFGGGYDKGANIAQALNNANFRNVEILGNTLVRGVK